MPTILALDFGIYTWPLTLDQLRQAKAAGYEGCIIGGWHGQSANRYFILQAELAFNAGLLVPARYALIAPPSWTAFSPSQQVRESMQGYSPERCAALTTIAIDAEVDITPDMLLEALTEAKKYGRTCIYTGAWWWNWFILRYHDWFAIHPSVFADEPAWLADYDWLPILDTPRLAHLGPVIGKQFKGSTREVAGINADLNVFDADWLGMEDEMTPEEVKAIVDKAVAEALAGKIVLDLPLEYRVHIQNIGWQAWKKLGQMAGTTGQSLQIEAIEIRLAPE